MRPYWTYVRICVTPGVVNWGWLGISCLQSATETSTTSDQINKRPPSTYQEHRIIQMLEIWIWWTFWTRHVPTAKSHGVLIACKLNIKTQLSPMASKQLWRSLTSLSICHYIHSLYALHAHNYVPTVFKYLVNVCNNWLWQILPRGLKIKHTPQNQFYKNAK